MNNAAKKLKMLEKKFSMAQEVLEELPNVDSDLVVAEVVDVGEAQLDVINADNQTVTDDIFSLQSLKADFVLVRQNLLKLINTGQTILTQVQFMDVGDMHPQHLSALATLQTTVGQNLKLLIELYEKIIRIENMKKGKKIDGEETGEGKGSLKIDKAIVFTGSTKELLAMMDKKDE
jgi:hypothetical protein